jgi:hypothetical protein
MSSSPRDATEFDTEGEYVGEEGEEVVQGNTNTLNERAGLLPTSADAQGIILYNSAFFIALVDIFVSYILVLFFLLIIFGSSQTSDDITFFWFNAGHFLLGLLLLLAGCIGATGFVLFVLIFALLTTVADGVGLALRVVNIILPCSPGCGLLAWLNFLAQFTLLVLAALAVLVTFRLYSALNRWRVQGMTDESLYEKSSPAAPDTSSRRSSDLAAVVSGGKSSQVALRQRQRVNNNVPKHTMKLY